MPHATDAARAARAEAPPHAHAELPPKTHVDREAAARLNRLWSSILVPPLAYLFALSGSYFFVEAECRQARPWALLLFYGFALALVALCAVIGWRARRDVVHDRHEDEDIPHSRAKFMAAGGLLLCAFSALLIAGTAFPVFVLRPCD